MSEERYCEPCRRLMRGDLSVRKESTDFIQFDHHLDYGSFERAMQLPCLLCTWAWAHQENSLKKSRWDAIIGIYFYSGESEGKRFLKFFTHSIYLQIWSSQLVLENLPSLTEVSICHALPSNTSDALQFLIEQYHDCCANHAQCSSDLESPQSGQYPLRLLDVGLEGSPIILRSTQMFTNQEYTCLSHCWGNSKPYTLNSITQRDLESGIDAGNLPKTFQDAIHVTRCLGVQYLWIDSLCILQDSESDWATESARMDQVYARAACTIAATASINSEGGLFFERHPETLLPCLLDIHFDSDASWLRGKDEGFRLTGTYICDIKEMSTYCIEKAPLNSRAWVSQERQLSRRIMHFSNRQLFWECHGKITCEIYPSGVPEKALPYWHDDSTMLKRHLHKFKQQDETFSDGDTISLLSEPGLTDGLYWAWCSFRVNYSSSALSRESDKLVALRGIAKHVSEVTGDELIAGLWKSRMIEELCWFKRIYPRQYLPTQPIEWRAPTWSWAACNDVIWISTLTKFHRKHQGRCFEAELIDINVETKLSGELAHGSMEIKCKPLLATIIPNSNTPRPYYELQGCLRLIEDDLHRSNTTFGEEVVIVPSRLNMDDPNFCEPRQVYIVVIQRCLHENLVQGDQSNRVQDTDESGIPIDPQGSILRNDEKSVQSQEVNPKNRKSWELKLGMLEGLLLQANDKDQMAFSRIGTFSLESLEAARPILNAHLKAESKVITLT